MGIILLMQNSGAIIALHHMPTGARAMITRFTGAHENVARAQAMGLREGKCVEVLRRSGRLLLIQVGATQLAISDDLARHVEVQ